MVKFSKFCSESFHRDTDRRCCIADSTYGLYADLLRVAVAAELVLTEFIGVMFWED